jgi:type IV fimbrial biogenesis protein FimT
MRNLMPGFTLLELMVVIALASILLAIGAPSFTELSRNGRMTSAANDWLGALYAARAEAIKRRAFVTVCATPDPTAAPPACSGVGDDVRGWLLFVDDDQDCSDAADDPVDGCQSGFSDIATDANAAFDGGAGEVLLRTQAFADTITVTPDSLFVIYEQAGFVRASKGGTASARRILFCDERGNVQTYTGPDSSAARGIDVSVTGRPGITRSVARIGAAVAANGFGGCP